MSSMAILTLSYRPDVERFQRLHESVQAHTPDTVMHHVVVPRRDYRIFRQFSGPRLTVWQESELMSAGFVATDSLSAFATSIPGWPSTLRCSAINFRHPWPPIRGWVLQQLLKLSAAPALGADVVVIIDSDVVLVRDMEIEHFKRGGVVRLYENPNAISKDMVRHLDWTHTAHRLLGLPEPAMPTYPDYIGGIVSWDPRLVDMCLKRIEEVAGCSWETAIGREPHFSEFILYGTYLYHFGTPEQRQFVEPRTLCHSYWKQSVMTQQDRDEFVGSFTEWDLAVHIQSNSGTSMEFVDDVVEELSGR